MNTPTFGLGEAVPYPQLYMPIFASRIVNMAPRLDAMSYVMRTTLTPGALAEPVRRTIGEVDSNLALGQVRTVNLSRFVWMIAYSVVLAIALAFLAALAWGVHRVSLAPGRSSPSRWATEREHVDQQREGDHADHHREPAPQQ